MSESRSKLCFERLKSDGEAGKTCETGFERVSEKSKIFPHQSMGDNHVTIDIGSDPEGAKRLRSVLSESQKNLRFFCIKV
ncbi:hypothetical protein [uncultured Treponema sp.]|uniref:hypothetical protein n=1 Tax=uncultured Treponema sp. TaxID=162155 RepID=UPI00260D4F93|nr:hypothetical protein [uncultured Treponema sp.]